MVMTEDLGLTRQGHTVGPHRRVDPYPPRQESHLHEYPPAARVYSDSRSIIGSGGGGGGGRAPPWERRANLPSWAPARGCLARDMPSLLRGAILPAGPSFSAFLGEPDDTHAHPHTRGVAGTCLTAWRRGEMCMACFQMWSYKPEFADIVLLEYTHTHMG